MVNNNNKRIIIIIIVIIIIIIWFNHQYLKLYVQSNVVFKDNKIQEVGHYKHHSDNNNRDVELFADTEQPHI